MQWEGTAIFLVIETRFNLIINLVNLLTNKTQYIVIVQKKLETY